MINKKLVLRSFTFIELLFVIVIIAVMAGISVPRLKSVYNRMQFSVFCADLQSLMNYIHDRSVVEQEVMTLTIDNKNRSYWLEYKESQNKEKTHYIPKGIEIEADSTKVFFYPNGDIDKVTVKIKGADSLREELTTKGVFGGIKLNAH